MSSIPIQKGNLQTLVSEDESDMEAHKTFLFNIYTTHIWGANNSLQLKLLTGTECLARISAILIQ